MSDTLTATRNGRLTRGPVEFLGRAACFWFGETRARAGRARTMKILHDLSDEQLRDIGLDRSLVHAGPEMRVDARLMTTLLSLR
ncbi:DUF1127 domain-containing protein [Rhizobium puerariae]|uniref:DUF1127 domain-containing protein n=1 Tax=Rhizobium puerariae TaxID=1585791 RepID=A0ABV6ARJ1_9HYPH